MASFLGILGGKLAKLAKFQLGVARLPTTPMIEAEFTAPARDFEFTPPIANFEFTPD